MIITDYQFKLEMTDQGLLIHTRGDLQYGPASEFGELLQNTVQTGLYRRVVVDIREITLMDSSGIAALLKGKRSTPADVEYRVLVTLGSQPHRILAAAGLIAHVGVFFDLNLLAEIA